MIDAKYLVTNRDAIAALRDLVFREGIFAGPSSGAVLVAAAREAKRLGSGTIVALLPDGGWKYLSAGTYSRDLARWRRISRAASTGGERGDCPAAPRPELRGAAGGDCARDRRARPRRIPQ